jgi:leucyl-tRNA synthetase
MILVNAFTNAPTKSVSALRTLLLLLNPFAPHLTSELWQTLAEKFPGADGEITAQRWPKYDEALLIEDEIEIVLQVNGKLRDKITVALEATNAEIEAAAVANQKVQNAVGGQAIRKVVVVPKKLVNVVTR